MLRKRGKTPQRAEVLGHPSVVLGELDATAASRVD